MAKDHEFGVINVYSQQFTLKKQLPPQRQPLDINRFVNAPLTLSLKQTQEKLLTHQAPSKVNIKERPSHYEQPITSAKRPKKR